MQYKELITNSDFEQHSSFRGPVVGGPICYASNNSDENCREYRTFHNCAWKIAIEDNTLDSSFSESEIDCLYIAVRNSGVPHEDDLVFWNNKISGDEGIVLFGGWPAGNYPPHSITLFNFDKIDPDIKQIDFLLAIYDAEPRKLDFSELTKIRVRIESDKKDFDLNAAYGEECENIYQYDIASIPYESNVLKIGSFVRDPDGWIYKPVVEGFDKGLKEVLPKYGFFAD